MTRALKMIRSPRQEGQMAKIGKEVYTKITMFVTSLILGKKKAFLKQDLR